MLWRSHEHVILMPGVGRAAPLASQVSPWTERRLLHLLCAAGTLTVQGLELQSIVSVNNGRFEPASNDMTHLPPSLPQLLASCHGLAWLGQTLVGDPLDQKLFAASGWNLVDVEHGGKAGGAAAVAPGAVKQLALVHPPGQPGKAAAVVRRFEFSSQLMRNAVVVQTGVMLAPGGDGWPATPGIGLTANGAVAAAAAVGVSADTEDLLGGSLLAAAPSPGKSPQASSEFVVFVKGSPAGHQGVGPARRRDLRRLQQEQVRPDHVAFTDHRCGWQGCRGGA